MTNITVTLQSKADVHCNTHDKKNIWKTKLLSPIKNSISVIQFNFSFRVQACACFESSGAFWAFAWNNKENRRTSVSVYLCMSMCVWVVRGCLHLCVSDYLCAKQRTCLQVWVDAQVGREYFVYSLEWMQTLTDRPLFRWRGGCGRCVTRTFVYYFGVPRLSDGCLGLFDQVIYSHLKTTFFGKIPSYLFTKINPCMNSPFSCSWKQEKRQRSDGSWGPRWQSTLAKQLAQCNNSQVYSWYHICDWSYCLANTCRCTIFVKVTHQKLKHVHISYHITTLTPACEECVNICII